MTTDEALATLEEVGIKVSLKEGRPTLKGDRAKVTPTMLAMLRWHRDAIVKRLAGEPTPCPPACPPACPPCPDLIVWRLCGDIGWAFTTRVDRECFIRRYALVGWRLPGETSWLGLADLPPSWGFVVEGRP